MKRKLSTLFMMIVGFGLTQASDIVIDGIWYKFSSISQSAEVTFKGSEFHSYENEYTDSVIIPASVVYNETSYSVTRIGDRAFSGCSKVTYVSIPNSVTSIGEAAFASCYSLTTVTIPNSVDKSTIGRSSYGSQGVVRAFENVPNVESEQHSQSKSSRTALGSRSVNGYVEGYLIYNDESKTELFACSAAASGNITISESVGKIGTFAFMYCSDVTDISFGENVTKIGNYAFSNCIGLTSVALHDGVDTIGNYSFSACNNLKTISLPNSVTYIGMGAFNECSSLASITIPSGISCIRSQTFFLCSSLSSVSMPDNITWIGAEAFCGSGLSSISISANVDDIRDRAFMGCSHLTSITCKAAVPPTLGNNVFDYVDKSIPLYVPAGSTDDYKAAEGWKEFFNTQDNSMGVTNVFDDYKNTNGKLLHDGQILIQRDDKTYTLQGQEVK